MNSPSSPELPPFANGPEARVFRFNYRGESLPLHDYLLERYRYGRDDAWARNFYPHRVRLNGEVVKADTTVHPGDGIEYLHLRREEPAPHPPAVLHEDDWMLALEKPDSFPVNPSGVYYFTSLAILAREFFGNPGLTPLHRLDLETSGPVLFAKDPAHLASFHRMFHEGRITKRYRALVHGRFPVDLREITGRIVPDPQSRIRTRLKLVPGTPGQAARREDRSAATPPGISHTRILGSTPFPERTGGEISELWLEPVTGKTNQLRVHLAHVGHPIVGDKKYHPDEAVFLDWIRHRDFSRLRESLLLPRQALHCELLEFAHPFTGKAVKIASAERVWENKVAGLDPPLPESPAS
jgi:23S rRNA-/tRNA-specific pseudouridylate synthase